MPLEIRICTNFEFVLNLIGIPFVIHTESLVFFFFKTVKYAVENNARYSFSKIKYTISAIQITLFRDRARLDRIPVCENYFRIPNVIRRDVILSIPLEGARVSYRSWVESVVSCKSLLKPKIQARCKLGWKLMSMQLFHIIPGQHEIK